MNANWRSYVTGHERVLIILILHVQLRLLLGRHFGHFGNVGHGHVLPSVSAGWFLMRMDGVDGRCRALATLIGIGKRRSVEAKRLLTQTMVVVDVVG